MTAWGGRISLCLAILMSFPASAVSLEAENKVRALVVPKQQTVLSAQIPGKINRLTVNEGDRFKKGQALASLDCTIHRLQLEEYRAELHGAEKTVSVQRQLAGLNSGNALEGAMAEANMGRVKAKIAMAEATIEMCDIKAPFDGRVVEKKINAHQNVTAGQPVLEILDDSTLEVELIVPSKWLVWLKSTTAFHVTIDEGGKDFTGSITRIGARIDPASQSVKVVGELAGGTGKELVAGMRRLMPLTH